jgi:hypothetical protein
MKHTPSRGSGCNRPKSVPNKTEIAGMVGINQVEPTFRHLDDYLLFQKQQIEEEISAATNALEDQVKQRDSRIDQLAKVLLKEQALRRQAFYARGHQRELNRKDKLAFSSAITSLKKEIFGLQSRCAFLERRRTNEALCKESKMVANDHPNRENILDDKRQFI